jgi:hypothetical protein
MGGVASSWPWRAATLAGRGGGAAAASSSAVRSALHSGRCATRPHAKAVADIRPWPTPDAELRADRTPARRAALLRTCRGLISSGSARNASPSGQNRQCRARTTADTAQSCGPRPRTRRSG